MSQNAQQGRQGRRVDPAEVAISDEDRMAARSGDRIVAAQARGESKGNWGGGGGSRRRARGEVAHATRNLPRGRAPKARSTPPAAGRRRLREVSEANVVEAAGVEPASENASERTSTRVGTLFRVSRSPAAADLRAQQADFVSTSVRQRVRRSSLIVSVLLSYRRKPREPSMPV